MKGLEAMLGVPKDKDAEPVEEADEWTEAGEDLLEAIESKDAAAIGLVLKRMCGGEDYEVEGETDEE